MIKQLCEIATKQSFRAAVPNLEPGVREKSQRVRQFKNNTNIFNKTTL